MKFDSQIARSYLIIIFLVPLLVLLYACNSSSVEDSYWEGQISQDDNFGISNSYESWLKIKKNGNIITGEGYYASSMDTSLFLHCTFEGVLDEDTFRLKEDGILKAATIKGEWYTKDILLYHPNGDKNQLVGNWVAHKNRNAVGVMRYSRAD